MSAQKTPRLVEELRSARWTGSPRTDADGQCEFRYQPEGWGKAYRFVALRYLKKPKPQKRKDPEQYQLFDTPEYCYRVFVTDLEAPIGAVVGFYRQRAGAENLIKEANNDAGLAAHPSARWAMNWRGKDSGLRPSRFHGSIIRTLRRSTILIPKVELISW